MLLGLLAADGERFHQKEAFSEEVPLACPGALAESVFRPGARWGRLSSRSECPAAGVSQLIAVEQLGLSVCRWGKRWSILPSFHDLIPDARTLQTLILIEPTLIVPRLDARLITMPPAPAATVIMRLPPVLRRFARGY